MTSNGGQGEYDRALLADAPAATREMLQEGYNADLLRPTQSPPDQNRDLELGGSGAASKENLSGSRTSPNQHPHPQRRAVPFWRTRKGLIIIAVVVAVVIAAVIGGAVGGTRHHNSSPGNDTAQQSSGSGVSNVQGEGSASNTPSGFTVTTITTLVPSTEAGGVITSVSSTFTSTITSAADANGVGVGSVAPASSPSAPPAGGGVTQR